MQYPTRRLKRFACGNGIGQVRFRMVPPNPHSGNQCHALVLMVARLCFITCLAAWAPWAQAQKTPTLPIPDDASAEWLIQRIRRLADFERSEGDRAGLQGFGVRTVARQQTLAHIDTLLTRFPDTGFKSEALIVKLAAMAELARFHPIYLTQLLELTDEIGRTKATGELASEGAYFAIQAFVLGARREKMPEQRRLSGTRERYESFLKDHSKSKRVAVIRASLIRNLIVLGQVELAREQLDKLRREFPDHRATRRAAGELYRVTAVGRPFSLSHTTPDGKTIRTTDYLGRIVVVHFWAVWSDAAMRELPELIALHEEFKGRGLQLIGVNVDTDRKLIEEALEQHAMPWPHYFDEKGLENDALVATGVLKIPTYFVVDRRGILRGIDPGRGLRALVEKLFAESPAKP